MKNYILNFINQCVYIKISSMELIYVPERKIHKYIEIQQHNF